MIKKRLFLFTALFAFCAPGCHGGEKGTFSIADSVLLFGEFDHKLTLVAPDHSQPLSIPSHVSRTRPLAVASLQHTGDQVTWGFPAADDPAKPWKVRCSVGIFSTFTGTWKTYGDFSQIHATAISPDGSKVAFIADETDSESRELLLLDVSDGRITKLARILAVSVSWSPDGKSLVIGTPGGEVPPELSIFDFGSGSIHVLAKGHFPAWSSSGNWIAYFDASSEQVRVVHPDGTGDHKVADVGGRVFGYRYFGLPPVWSPDSTKLLLNEYKGDGDTQDVVLLDINTGKMATKSHNGYSILGWARSTGKTTASSDAILSRSASPK